MEETNEQLIEQLVYLQALLHRFQSQQPHQFQGFQNPHRGQGRVLLMLSMQENITQKELGYLLDMRNQSLSELLAKLEQKGFITRTQSQQDRRTTLICLTQAGKTATEALHQESGPTLNLFEEFSDEEKANLFAYLHRMITTLKKQLVDTGIDTEGFDEEHVRAFFERRRAMFDAHRQDGGKAAPHEWRRGYGKNGFGPF